MENYTNQDEQKMERGSRLASEAVLPLAALVVLFLIILLLLNYLNILSLSKMFPAQLGWLPHKPFELKGNITYSNVLPVSCPVEKDICNTKKQLDDGQFKAVGFNLKEDARVLAAFDGKLEDTPIIPYRSASQPYLYLRDQAGNEIIYSFYGTVSVPIGSDVKKGDEIGKIGEGTFPVDPMLAGLNFFVTSKNGENYKQVVIE
ncbi:MAG: hypothetical protein C4584_00455 [Armatimonadetes bacterium]|nr:MAG: hypothetical protein C4584_00455 [Armatimonadota bacterium]